MRKKGDGEPRESRLADGWTVESRPAEPAEPATQTVATGDERDPRDEAIPAVGETPTPQLSNGGLVLLGIIGGVYLLYTWVWISWANTYSTLNSAVADGSGLLGSVMQQIVFWLAPFAPALWFFAVLVLNRGARLRRLVLWLLIGAVVLVPLPMFEFGAA